MARRFDMAIIGSGFAGSLTALILRRLGWSVLLLERDRHPRFAIGESSTPLANLLVEQLGERYDLNEIAALSKWGTWQTTHPELACGLKRGFSFYHHEWGKAFEPDPQRRNELLVAASPQDRIADTHWFRADFDRYLVELARQAGVEYRDATTVGRIDWDQEGAILQTNRSRSEQEWRAGFIIDASGPRGCLHRLLNLPERPLRLFPATQGVFTHFQGVQRWQEIEPPPEGPLPYPVDDAALHHVFDGGWIWVLHFNNGISSAGAAITDRLAEWVRPKEGHAAWDRLLSPLPAVRRQFARARPVRPFVHVPRLAWMSGAIAGPRWVQLPSAAGFIDPLLSTGFPLTLLGICRLTEIFEQPVDPPKREKMLAEYARRTTEELLAVERLVTALYSTMDDFELFARITLLYFAAASFTETAWRLNRAELAGRSFLMSGHPTIGPAIQSCLEQAIQHGGQSAGSASARFKLIGKIAAAIEPIDIAGLNDETRRNWFPVRSEDLFESAHKLEATSEEIAGMLARCGFSFTRSPI